MTIHDLQADAYRRLAKLINDPAYQARVEHKANTRCFACEMQRIVDETERAAKEFELTAERLIFELARTRFIRLPRTQFAWAPMSGVPQIERQGVRRYLQGQVGVYEIPRQDAYDAIAKIEQDLWDAEDCETVVFWRGWAIYELSDTHLQARTQWFAAYIFDGDVYTDRAEFKRPENQEILRSRPFKGTD